VLAQRDAIKIEAQAAGATDLQRAIGSREDGARPGQLTVFLRAGA
jgi:hypothetical protein